MGGCGSSNSEVVKVLIDRGADVHAKNRDGFTVLLRAVEWGTPEVLKLLLDKGLDVSAKTQNGETLLMYAAQSRNLGTLKFLTIGASM